MADNEEQLIEILGVLAEGVRFRILSLIASKGELAAKDILAEFDFTQPTLSHHMSVLCAAGLVNSRHKGRYTYYSVNKETTDLIASFIKSLGTGPKKASKTKPVKTVKSVKADKPAVTDEAEKLKKSKKKKKKDKSKKKKKE